MDKDDFVAGMLNSPAYEGMSLDEKLKKEEELKESYDLMNKICSSWVAEEKKRADEAKAKWEAMTPLERVDAAAEQYLAVYQSNLDYANSMLINNDSQRGRDSWAAAARSWRNKIAHVKNMVSQAHAKDQIDQHEARIKELLGGEWERIKPSDWETGNYVKWWSSELSVSIKWFVERDYWEADARSFLTGSAKGCKTLEEALENLSIRLKEPHDKLANTYRRVGKAVQKVAFLLPVKDTEQG